MVCMGVIKKKDDEETRSAKCLKLYSANIFIGNIIRFCQSNTRLNAFLKFIITTAIMVHMVGWVWFFVARVEDFSPDTWVVRYGIENETKETQYYVSIYWAITTLTTIGYGDITPGTNIERLVACVWMLVGVGFYSFTIGSMTTVLGNIDTKNGILT